MDKISHCSPHPASQTLLFREPLPAASSQQLQDSVSPSATGTSVALTGQVSIVPGGASRGPGSHGLFSAPERVWHSHRGPTASPTQSGSRAEPMGVPGTLGAGPCARPWREARGQGKDSCCFSGVWGSGKQGDHKYSFDTCLHRLEQAEMQGKLVVTETCWRRYPGHSSGR